MKSALKLLGYLTGGAIVGIAAAVVLAIVSIIGLVMEVIAVAVGIALIPFAAVGIAGFVWAVED